MDVKVLRFQNRKLGERLEEMKCEEDNLKLQIEEYKKRERDNTELLSVIHRAWNQVIDQLACPYLCLLSNYRSMPLALIRLLFKNVSQDNFPCCGDAIRKGTFLSVQISRGIILAEWERTQRRRIIKLIYDHNYL